MLFNKRKRLTVAISLLLISTVLMGTASYAWFAMNTEADVNGYEVEATSDSQFLEISLDDNLAEDSWDLSASYYGTAEALMTVTQATLTSTDEIHKATFTAASGYFASGSDDYYKRADSDSGTSTDEKQYNYIKVTDLVPASSLTTLIDGDTLEFVRIGNTANLANGTYYRANGNGYTAITKADALKGDFIIRQSQVAVTNGTFTLATGSYTKELADADHVYWEKDSSGNLARAKNLTYGTPLTGYYTTTSTALSGEARVFDGNSIYYLKSGNNFICLGKPAEGAVDGYRYWARTYSNNLEQVQTGNPMNIINMDALITPQNYYLHDTIYLRQGPNTNDATNLRVESVTVGGTTNFMTNAIRVLFVATSNAGDKEVEVIYSARDNSLTNNGQILKKLLGNAEEVVTVQVYIYFDGTDADVSNDNMGVLNGQTISIKFAIDELPYNK